jgi:hypothetical protein
MDHSENSLLKHALLYSQKGMHVFPVKPKGKTPLTKNGFKDASIDFDQIVKWWTQWPDANIGIATGKISGFWVLDIDGEYPEDWPAVGASPTVKTARGAHCYFKYPDGQEVKSQNKIQGEDIDIKGDGGYIIAPPSVHPSGVCYEFFA